MIAAAQAQSDTPASLSARDLQVLGRSLAFVQPPPGTLAIAYAPRSAASRHDADALAAALASGLRSGTSVLHPVVVETTAVASGHFGVVIAAAGANGPELSAATRATHTLCVTAELEAVQAALCTMAIRSEPRVDIVVSHAAAAAGSVEFAAAFRMMIREL